MNRFRFEAVGTYWEVDTPEELDDALRADVRACAEAFDAVYSRSREDSLVTRMSAVGGAFEFPADAEALFDIYDRLHRATDGAVDPLVGLDLELLGYDHHYTLQPNSSGIERHASDRVTTEQFQCVKPVFTTGFSVQISSRANETSSFGNLDSRQLSSGFLEIHVPRRRV